MYSPKQIQGFGYNGYLTLSTTGNIANNNFYSNQNYADYLSIFMVFGYANGTDSTVDISKFIFKENFELDNNFFLFLFQNLTIENNIFGYHPTGIINLVSIPEEISIEQYDLDTQEKY